MKYLSIIFTISFVWIKIFLTLTYADVDFSSKLSLSPSFVRIFAYPGEEVEFVIRIKNEGENQFIKLDSRKLKILTNSSNFQIVNEKKDLEGEIKLYPDISESQIFLKRNSWVEIPVRAFIPSNIDLGEYYYVFFADAKANMIVLDDVNISSDLSIGSVIVFSITQSENISISPTVSYFDVLSSYKVNMLGNLIVFSSKNIPLLLKISNPGKYGFFTDGDIQIKGPGGLYKRSEVIKKYIPSTSTRLVSFYQGADAGYSYLLSTPRIGKYSFQVRLKFDDNPKNIILLRKEFFFIPTEILLLFLILLLIFTTLVRYGRNIFKS